MEDSKLIFGEYLHHFPYFGMFGGDDHKNLENSFELTKVHYRDAFGEDLDRKNGISAEFNKCHTCRNSCSHCNRPSGN